MRRTPWEDPADGRAWEVVMTTVRLGETVPEVDAFEAFVSQRL